MTERFTSPYEFDTSDGPQSQPAPAPAYQSELGAEAAEEPEPCSCEQSERLLERIAQLERDRVAIDLHSAGLIMTLTAERAETARLRAKLETQDVCWHCKDVLVPADPMCHRCPAPGDCDDEDCQADGCVERREPKP